MTTEAIAAPTDVELDLAEVAAATGVRLSLASHRTLPGTAGSRETWELVDGRAGQVLLRRDSEAPWSQNPGCLLGMRAVSRLAARRRERIRGVGNRASWSARRRTLVAYRDGTYVTATVFLQDVPPQTERDVAVALARQII
jgi:hypothetical protein